MGRPSGGHGHQVTHCRNAALTQGLFYVPNFISEEEQAQLLQALDAAPARRWTAAGERQMQNWGGRPGEAVVREVCLPVTQSLPS